MLIRKINYFQLEIKFFLTFSQKFWLKTKTFELSR